MIHIIILILIAVLFVINLILLINVSKNPMYNAMDKYNDPAKLIGFDWGLVNRIEERLSKLECDFKYHIQSTDELKPKA